jgi:WD40 repeat protein
VSGSRDDTVKIWDAQTGSELRSLEGHSDSVTNVSLRNVHIEHEQGSQISVEGSWVCFRGERVIWLPSELRGPSCHAINNDILTLGYGNGLVLVISFRAHSD